MMRTALQFSGGKDSLALLFHLEALLPMLDVVILDTGDLTEAAKKNIGIALSMTKNVTFITGNSKRTRQNNGEPTSSNWIQCCAESIWLPMANFIKEKGYRQVMRGTKRCDPYIHGVFPGDVIDNTLYTMPLWHWSDDDVKRYLQDKLPAEYLAGAEGMPDCVSCPVPEACGGRTRRLWT